MKPNSGFSQLIILFVVTIIIGGVVLFTYVSSDKTQPVSTPIPSTTPEPSPSVVPSPQIATPSASVTTKVTTGAPVAKQGFNLATVTLEAGKERRLLTLRGNSFGTNGNRVIFDDDASKYANYGMYNWYNDKIELFLSKDTPDNQTVKVAVVRTDGTKSNALTFNTKQWDKSGNNKFDCKSPTNFKGNAVSPSEIQLTWDTDPNVKYFHVLQNFYTETGESHWIAPMSVASFDGLPNGSFSVKGLAPYTQYTFSVTVWCNNGYASDAAPSLTINTLQ